MLDLAIDGRQRPRLLAFVQAWRPDAIQLLRARISQFDADLVIVSDAGAWSVSRERCDRINAGNAKTRYGVTGDAIFVVDHRGVIRFAHHDSGVLGTKLPEALDVAVQALGWRDHQSKLERIQWTPRAWAIKSLVVGCSLTFIGQPVARMARGTGPIQKIEASSTATPVVEPSAAVPTVDWPSTPIARISLRRSETALARKKQEA